MVRGRADPTEVVLLGPGAVTHAFNHNQRYVGCTITGASANEVHATAPPGANVARPGHHLLFLVDHDPRAVAGGVDPPDVRAPTRQT